MSAFDAEVAVSEMPSSAIELAPPPRSSRREVRNPLVALPGFKMLRRLPPESRHALRAILIDLRDDCRARADKCWRTHKAPMAAYYKAIGVYANHLSRLLKDDVKD